MIGDVFELAIRYTVLTKQCVTTHHFRQAVAHDTPETTLHDHWITHGHGEFISMLKAAGGGDPDQILNDVVIRQVGLPGQALRAAQIFSHTEGGTRATGGRQEPPFMSARVTVQSAAAGRRHRGRFYVSGLGRDDVVVEDLIPGDTLFLAHLLSYCGATGIGAFLAAGAPDFEIGVWSRRLAGYPPPETESSRRPETTPAALPVPASASLAFTPATALVVRRNVKPFRRRTIEK